MTASPLTVDLVSDIVCPWCYIGKRRLASALQLLQDESPGRAVNVRWHPFQLNPDLPSQGMDRRAYVEAKFGSREHADANYRRIRDVGETVGLDLRFDAILRQPNTLDAHRVIAWAQSRPGHDVDALMEALFAAYFTQGRFIGDRSVLSDVAAGTGIDRDAVAAMLESGHLATDVATADERARNMGIEGVPFFIFNGKVALSGAHEPEALLQAIAQAG